MESLPREIHVKDDSTWGQTGPYLTAVLTFPNRVNLDKLFSNLLIFLTMLKEGVSDIIQLNLTDTIPMLSIVPGFGNNWRDKTLKKKILPLFSQL